MKNVHWVKREVFLVAQHIQFTIIYKEKQRSSALFPLLWLLVVFYSTLISSSCFSICTYFIRHFSLLKKASIIKIVSDYLSVDPLISSVQLHFK